MKSTLLMVCCFAAVYSSNGQSYSVVERGPHHRTFEKTAERVEADGSVRTETERFVELATGLHYLKDNQWLETQELIELFDGAAIARQGPHQVIWSANANTPGAIDLQTPAGRFRSHVLGIAYTDRASGKSVMIAGIKDSIGTVVGANQVVYPDAFDGLRASIRYTYTRAGLEQDILLEEAPRPPGDYDPTLNPATTRLEVYTEFVEAPAVNVQVHLRKQETDLQLRQAMAFPDVTDQSLDFGSMHIGSGHAFLTGAETDKTVVQKEWVQLEGRQFLIESLEVSDAQPLLNTLPQAAALDPQQRAARMAKLQAPRKTNGQFARAFPKAPGKKTVTEAMRLASVHPARKALVLDYFTLNSSLTNYVFNSVETYLILAPVFLYGPSNVMEGGAVVKYT
ncbi:MAG: hypothetical protein L0Z53_23100, partial [Acidobacteriales bacterium]|nr:hypothetical protein [Terriglobales bacterium]